MLYNCNRKTDEGGSNMEFSLLKSKEPITIIGHRKADVDSLISCFLVSKLLTFKGIKNVIKFQDNYREDDFKYTKIDYSKIGTGLGEKDKLFLVDHSGLYENEVVGCIEHHPILYKEVAGPNVIEKRTSSCAKLVYEIMMKEGMKETKEIIFLTVLSLYCDTLSFKLKAKVRNEDIIWAKEKIKEYNFEENYFYQAGLRTTNLHRPLIEIVNNKYKEIYITGDKLKIGSSCVIAEFLPDNKWLLKIIKLTKEELIKKDLNIWLSIFIELETNRSFVVKTYRNGNYETMYYNYIVSRGRDILSKYTT